ncbi:MAG: CHAD domain-containing protein [Deltaproteobacteria bacterium]|nr:CHAD domain-containing protein [Deltaproteobacteria bacterium]
MPLKKKKSTDPSSAWRSFTRQLQKKLSKLRKDIRKLDSKSSRATIHRLRVLSRRVRAMLAVFKAEPQKNLLKSIEKPVKKLTRLLSPIRSLDVSAKLMEDHLFKVPAPERGPLRDAITALRRQQREARRGLGKASRRLQAALKSVPLDRWEDPDAGRRFLPALRRRLRSARSRAARALREYRRTPGMHRLHEFRITLKKYRYLLEIHADALRRAEPALRTLKTLQDYIGTMHDLEVLRQWLQDPKVSRTIAKKEPRRALARFTAGLAAEVAVLEKSFLSRQGRRLSALFPREVP